MADIVASLQTLPPVGAVAAVIEILVVFGVTSVAVVMKCRPSVHYNRMVVATVPSAHGFSVGIIRISLVSAVRVIPTVLVVNNVVVLVQSVQPVWSQWFFAAVCEVR